MRRKNLALWKAASAVLMDLSEDPVPEGAVALRGHRDHFRIRLDGYRVVYRVRPGQVTVIRVRPRAAAYRGLD